MAVSRDSTKGLRTDRSIDLARKREKLFKEHDQRRQSWLCCVIGIVLSATTAYTELRGHGAYGTGSGIVSGLSFLSASLLHRGRRDHE